MAIYFVDASGNSPGGYTNFYNLFIGVSIQDDDIIEVVDNGEIDDSANIIGISNNNVIIRSWAGNINKPTIKGNNNSFNYVFRIDGDNVKIRGLKFKKEGPNANGSFITFSGGSYVGIEISGCEMWVVDITGMDSNTASINSSGFHNHTGLVIKDNHFYNLSMGITLNTSPFISLLVENNEVHDVTFNGFNCGGNAFTDCTFRKNKIYDVDIGMEFSGQGSTNLIIENNEVRDFITGGIRIVTSGGSNASPVIVNNSFRNFTGTGIAISHLANNGTFINNIINGISGAYGMSISADAGSILDNNIIYGCTYNLSYTGGVSPGASIIYLDPLFVSSTDLKLLPDSPAIDAGIGNGTNSNVPTEDIRGWNRPVNIEGYVNVDDGTDIGAYEMVLATAITGGREIDVINDDVSIVSTAVPLVIEAYPSVIAAENFQSESNWDKIIVEYRHANGQRIRIVHTLKTGGWIGNYVIANEARRGDWEKQLIILLDKVGDMLAIKRNEIGAFEDLILTSYYPSEFSLSSYSESSSSQGAPPAPA